MIQISKLHLSPFATRKQTKQLIEVLTGKGWPVVYGEDDPVWTFDQVGELDRFGDDFEAARRAILGGPFSWLIRSPDYYGKASREDSILFE